MSTLARDQAAPAPAVSCRPRRIAAVRGRSISSEPCGLSRPTKSTADDFRHWTSSTTRLAAWLVPGAEWGHNLDALNDILRGGFGTPNGGFVLRWLNSDLSRERLGHPETVRQLEARLARCDPSNRVSVARDLEQAQRGQGPTVFDWLIEILHVHTAGGGEEEDGVELVLA